MKTVTGNPVDLLASAGPDAYRHALRLLAESREYDALLPVFMHPIVTDATAVAEAFREVLADAPVPSLPCFMPAPEAADSLQILREAGFAVLTEPNRAAAALARWSRTPSPGGASWPPARVGLPAWPHPAPALGASRWGDPQVLEEYLETGQVRRPEQRRVLDSDGAETATRELGVPLALKIERAEEPHKKKAGLLELVRGPDDLAPALARLRARFHPGDRWLLQRLVPRGPEVFASFLRHPDLGPFVGLGRGGSAVERGEPPKWLSLPAGEKQAAEFFNDVPLLRELGEKGDPAVRAVTTLVTALARLAEAAPEVQVAEVNPAVWDPDAGVLWLVDARWQFVAPATAGRPETR